MADTWYYVSEKKKFGPFTFQQLSRLAASGRIRPTDSVVPPNSQQWVPASSVPGLFGPTGNPPLPTTQAGKPVSAGWKKLPLWVWLTAVPTAMVLLCCGGCGLYGLFFGTIGSGPQATKMGVASATSAKGRGGTKEVPPAGQGIDSSALRAEFKKDKAAAEKKYLGKTILIRGARVFSVQDQNNAVELQMDADSQPVIMCKFTGANKDRALRLQRDDVVNFRGKLDLVMSMSVWFEDCEIVD